MLNYSYDLELINEASDYWAECEPKAVSTNYEVDYDDDGNYVNIATPILNCHECDNRDCEHWGEYNE